MLVHRMPCTHIDAYGNVFSANTTKCATVCHPNHCIIACISIMSGFLEVKVEMGKASYG